MARELAGFQDPEFQTLLRDEGPYGGVGVSRRQIRSPIRQISLERVFHGGRFFEPTETATGVRVQNMDSNVSDTSHAGS